MYEQVFPDINPHVAWERPVRPEEKEIANCQIPQLNGRALGELFPGGTRQLYVEEIEYLLHKPGAVYAIKTCSAKAVRDIQHGLGKQHKLVFQAHIFNVL